MPPLGAPRIVDLTASHTTASYIPYPAGRIHPLTSASKSHLQPTCPQLSPLRETITFNQAAVATQDQRPVPPSPTLEPRRRSRFPSLPAATTILEEREDDSPSVPYDDGSIEVLPGIWLGSGDSARDWRALVKRGIKSILNVARKSHVPSMPLRRDPRVPLFQPPVSRWGLRIASLYIF